MQLDRSNVNNIVLIGIIDIFVWLELMEQEKSTNKKEQA
jgi:hypothetical protein